MSQSSLRHLHMGCGESLMGAWSALKKATPKKRQKKPHPDGVKQLNQTQKVKGAC